MRGHPEGPETLKAVCRVLDGRVGDDLGGFPRYPYNAGSAGLVDEAGDPTRSCVVILLTKVGERPRGGRSAFYY